MKPEKLSVLNVAPMVYLPPTDGAARRIWHLHQEVQALLGPTWLVTAEETISEDQTVRSQPRTLAAKWPVALRAAVTGRDYWETKFLTRTFVARCRQAAAALRPEVWLINMLMSVGLAPREAVLVVDSQNFDPAYFAAVRDANRNPLLRILCNRRIRRSLAVLADLPAGTLMIHVSQADAARYRVLRPDLPHEVICNGTSVIPRATSPDYTSGRRHLLFIGSLSAQMNMDALVLMGQRFWGNLQKEAGFTVAGSNPSSAVQRLCAAHGWQLEPDISETRLEELYRETHFAVLPFPYGEGSKLKLYEACGRAVPVLATTAGCAGVVPPPLVHTSEDPAEWERHVRTYRGPAPDAIAATLAFARAASWPELGKQLAAAILERRRVARTGAGSPGAVAA